MTDILDEEVAGVVERLYDLDNRIGAPAALEGARMLTRLSAMLAEAKGGMPFIDILALRDDLLAAQTERDVLREKHERALRRQVILEAEIDDLRQRMKENR